MGEDVPIDGLNTVKVSYNQQEKRAGSTDGTGEWTKSLGKRLAQGPASRLVTPTPDHLDSRQVV